MRRYVVAAAMVALTAALSSASAEEEAQATAEGDAAEAAEDGASTSAGADDRAEAATLVDAPLAVEAGRYAVYQEDVSGLEEEPFVSLEDIDAALEVVASHSPDKLSRSWIAYSALIAAQSPPFVDGVRQTADYYGRDAVIAGLRNDPSYAGQVTGAETARQAVLAAVTNDAERLRAVSATVKEQAYSLQSTGWASTRSGDNAARLAHLDEVALRPRSASGELLAMLAAPGAVGSDRMGDDATAELRANFWRAFRLGPGTAHAAAPGDATPLVDVAANPAYKSVLDQVVTLAAFEALDSANDADAAALEPLLEQVDTRQCMIMARLHFQQCVAASHFRFEDPFCIAEHGVKDIGDCLSKVVASAPPASHGAATDAPAETGAEVEARIDAEVEASVEAEGGVGP